MLQIFIDADGCPVKEEVYKVSLRYSLKTFVVANKPIKIPQHPLVEMTVVSGHFDAADDWICTHCSSGDIVITADIPLADRCLKNGARVLGTKGKEFTPDNIGSALASRELMSQLRDSGEIRGGPAPMLPKDRSQFLSQLDNIVQNIKRKMVLNRV